MKQLKIITKVFILLAVMALGTTLQIAQAQAPAPIIPTTIKGQISYYSTIYGSNSKELLIVARCESNFDPASTGDHGLARGVYQFHPDTFKLFSSLYQKQYGGPTLQYMNTTDQIKLASWMFTLGKRTKANWTCYTKNFT